MRKAAGWKVLAVLAVLVIVAGIVLHFQHRHAEQNTQPLATTSRNSESLPPGRPASRRQPTPPASKAVEQPDEPLAQLLALKLPRDTIEEYLRLHNRSAQSLLAAFHASGDAENPTGDLNYLKEAATNFPGDPHVQLAVLAHNAFPEARRQWLDAFKASSPGNSLANYLSAQDYFKNGQSDAAIKELLEVSSKPQFADFTMETALGEKELYRASGKSPLESNQAAKSALAGDLLPELSTLKGLAQSMGELQKQYANSSDSASAENLAQLNLVLANRLTGSDSGKLVISQLVGMALEAIALSNLEPNTSYAFLDGKTPSQRKEELKQQKLSIRQLSQSFQSVLPNLTEMEKENFEEREKIYGEVAAMRWVVEQRGTDTPSQGRP
jgi:hypothetical protein